MYIYLYCFFFIDEEGNEEPMKLNVARVWTLPPGKKVKVKFNRDRQPINEEGALLNSFLADLASDVKVLPISYRGWRKVPKADKDRCYNNFLKVLFIVSFPCLFSPSRYNISKVWFLHSFD